MAKMFLTEKDVDALLKNPYVESVTENRITYTDEFKRKFIDEYREGKGPRQIFKDAGFDVNALGYKRIERASDRWRRANNEGLLGEKIDPIKVHENRVRYRGSLDDVIARHGEYIEQLQNDVEKLKEAMSKSKATV